ncbi:hypothetical protein SK128_001220 [Halocaridina rubra]|uniref:Fucosyltransferase n=1 Tax=Halocaridina rubra TaxID=373956 RepID=A0AAN8WX50_HALRR
MSGGGHSSVKPKSLLAIITTLTIYLGVTINLFDIIKDHNDSGDTNYSYDLKRFNKMMARAHNTNKEYKADSIYQFKDEYFEPLLSLYRKKAKGLLDPTRKRFRSGEKPRVLLWSDPFIPNFWDAQLSHVQQDLCPLSCERNTADAIVIYLRGARSANVVYQNLSPRNPTQPWIMLTFEAPPRANSIYKTNYREFNGLFNRTMMYRYDADIRVPHGFVVKRDDAMYLPSTWVVPPILADEHMDINASEIKNITNSFTNNTSNIEKKRKLVVTFISNCQSKIRLNYIHDFQQYAPVEVYGKCGENICGHSMYVDHRYIPMEDPCLKIAGENYLFFFAFENAFCTDYITEKVYNLLYFPIVPVVFGSAKYSTLLPSGSYIDASKYTPRELARKLLYLQKHPMEYKKYLFWRYYYQPSTIGGERSLCHLCARLYDEDFYEYNVIEDFRSWFVIKSMCLEENIAF